MKKVFLFLMMILFALANGIAEEEVRELAIIAKRWDFFPSTITVKKDIPVRIFITSIDATHGFGLQEFDVFREIAGKKQNGGLIKLQKGQLTIVTFTPVKTGEFDFFCTVRCGSGHGGMKGTVIVEEQPDGNTF